MFRKDLLPPYSGNSTKVISTLKVEEAGFVSNYQSSRFHIIKYSRLNEISICKIVVK
jgi:hypothetical protein